MSISSIALIAALAVLPSAQDAEPRVETRSEIRIVTAGGDSPGRLDADDDGFVTREEFTAPFANAFERLDADDDGRLSTDELRSHHLEGDEHVGPMILNMRRGGPQFRMFGGGRVPGFSSCVAAGRAKTWRGADPAAGGSRSVVSAGPKGTATWTPTTMVA